MCIKMLESQSAVNMDEYLFFLKGGVVLDREEQMDNPCPGQSKLKRSNTIQVKMTVLFLYVNVQHIFTFSDILAVMSD